MRGYLESETTQDNLGLNLLDPILYKHRSSSGLGEPSSRKL